MNDIFKKNEETEAKYEKAQEAKQEELIVLQAELTEKQTVLKDLHKMYLLQEVSEETYQKEKEAVDKLQEKIYEVQHEIAIIDVYKTDDLQAILEQAEEVKKELNAEQKAELHKLKLELFEAKLEYLKKMAEARKKYSAIITPEVKIQNLKIKLGKQQTHYIPGTHDALFQLSLRNAGYINLRVEKTEVYNALEYGRIPSELQSVVSDAREKGIIE